MTNYNRLLQPSESTLKILFGPPFLGRPVTCQYISSDFHQAHSSLSTFKSWSSRANRKQFYTEYNLRIRTADRFRIQRFQRPDVWYLVPWERSEVGHKHLSSIANLHSYDEIYSHIRSFHASHRMNLLSRWSVSVIGPSFGCLTEPCHTIFCPCPCSVQLELTFSCPKETSLIPPSDFSVYWDSKMFLETWYHRYCLGLKALYAFQLRRCCWMATIYVLPMWYSSVLLQYLHQWLFLNR